MSQHTNADSLSCLPLKVTEETVDETAIFNIVQVETLPVTTLQVATATKKDPKGVAKRGGKCPLAIFESAH